MRNELICISKYNVSSPKISKELRFAFVSDLHLFPNRPIIDAIRSINPDVVLVGGDFIQSKTDIDSGMDFLKKAALHYPVYCSSGKEHDFNDTLCRIIEDTGAVFLRNQYMLFNELAIGGLNTLPLHNATEQGKEILISNNRKWLKTYSALSEYKLLLCHHPEYYDMFIRDYDVDLIVSGHAHGGQIRLFHQGLWAPGQGWFPKYTSGLYDGRLLVGRGLGNVHRIPRINNKPEILSITISAEKNMRQHNQM